MTAETIAWLEEQERLRQQNRLAAGDLQKNETTAQDEFLNQAIADAENISLDNKLRVKAERGEAREKFLGALLALTKESDEAFNCEDENQRRRKIESCIEQCEALREHFYGV